MECNWEVFQYLGDYGHVQPIPFDRNDLYSVKKYLDMIMPKIRKAIESKKNEDFFSWIRDNIPVLAGGALVGGAIYNLRTNGWFQTVCHGCRIKFQRL